MKPHLRLACALLLWTLMPACILSRGPRSVSFEHPTETTDSGVVLQDVLEGTGRSAELGRQASIDYVARLDNGRTVDSTYERGVPVNFVVGEAPLSGWNEGVRGMRVGGTRRLIVPPSEAYGEEGVPGLVPPGATLEFLIELLAVEGE